MKKLAFISILFLASCNSNSKNQAHDTLTNGTASCNSLPSSFASYDAAVSAVESADFEIADNANTSKSSWIRAARFYSCNNADGYFIIETDKGNYLHQGVPITLWESFKAANSFGSFYDANIRHHCRLVLN